MRKLLPVLGLAGLLGFTACTDPYGNPDPVATGLLGAGIGAAAGLAIASSTAPRYHHGPRYYGRPYGYHAGPRYYGRPYGYYAPRRYYGY